MAYPNRQSQQYLAELTGDSQALYQEGFEPFLRHIDANASLHSPIGYSVSLKQDPLRLGQTPTLHFHASPFSDVTQSPESGMFKLKNVYLGLFGSNGPLPLHFTEYAIERNFRHNDKTLTEFCDIFHHRFLSLFYRSWAESQPVVSYDRPEKDLFSYRAASFSGHFTSSRKAIEHVSTPKSYELQTLNNEKRFLSGLLSMKNKSVGALEQILSEYLQQEVSIQAFEGDWYPLPEEAICHLSIRSSRLGMDCVLGSSAFQRNFNYSILVGPLSYQDYLSLVNNNVHFKHIQKLAVHHTGLEYSFTIKLLLDENQKQSSVLGINQKNNKSNSMLGKNSWLSNNHQPTSNEISKLNSHLNRQHQKLTVAYQYAC